VSPSRDAAGDAGLTGADDSDASVSVHPGDPGDATARDAGETEEALEEAGPVAASTVIQLSIGLPLRNEQQIGYCEDLISEPTSPFFRHYLTEDQFDALYGPTECDYQALIDWVQSRGLTVDGTYSDRLLVGVSASAATIDAVFHVTLHYSTRPDGSQFYTPDRDPSFDLNVPVSGILGFDDCQVPMAI
jgi:subtilase family serine protease